MFARTCKFDAYQGDHCFTQKEDDWQSAGLQIRAVGVRVPASGPLLAIKDSKGFVKTPSWSDGVAAGTPAASTDSNGI